MNTHLPELDALMKKGVGLVCLHYGVEVPKGPSGEALLEWTGGYFEPYWSVNPHWSAQYSNLPAHPIARGVKPFETNDEWYYHMRFRPSMDGVTPILTALPPAQTLSRPDGPHSGNPAVREEIKNGVPQHMAWARERPDGGRGFGCTGGHNHWNWGNNEFRKLVLNAIVWTAKVDVPEGGVQSKPLTVEDLMANQDEPVPSNFQPESIQKMLDQWNGPKQ
jgi:type 1 glutamine amidotransferase